MKSSRRSRRWAKGKRELERGWPSQWSCVGPHSDVKPCLSVPVLMRSLVGWQEGEVDVSPDVLCAPCKLMRPPMARQPIGPDASRPALLPLVLRDLGGETVGLLQDLLDRGPSQKART